MRRSFVCVKVERERDRKYKRGKATDRIYFFMDIIIMEKSERTEREKEKL